MLEGDTLEPARLFPLRYEWAYAHLQQARRNTWFPEEAQLTDDVEDWNKRLSNEEKKAVETMLGFFNPMESIVASNIIFSIYPYVKAPEVRLYLIRQAWEEANHTLAFEYVIKTLPVDRESVFSLISERESAQKKEEFQKELTQKITSEKIDINSKKGKQTLVYNLIGYFVVLEGIFFYSGFAFFLSFRRRNLLKGLNTIIDWTLRDESLHLSFGINLINQIIKENNIFSSSFQVKVKDLITASVKLEEEYNNELIPKPLIGLNAKMLNEYVRYVADRRLEELGMKPIYNTKNPLRWMAVQTDIPEIVNFFEARNINYELGIRR
jgi:ribonucleoside-diphosphate reductase beta chain